MTTRIDNARDIAFPLAEPTSLDVSVEVPMGVLRSLIVIHDDNAKNVPLIPYSEFEYLAQES